MLKLITKKYFSQKVTFVGLGNMGYSMASNLIKGGFRVAGVDESKVIQDKFQADGGEKVSNLQDSVNDSDALITMLPNYKIINTVWEDAYKIAKKGTYFIDCSTTSPVDTKELAKKAKSQGFIPSDSPVTGGVMAAKNANLAFMVGCEKDHFEKVKSFLAPMGKNLFHCGENSFGQVAKISNNLCLAISMIGLSESLALGVKQGIDPKVLSQVMSVGSARCWSLDTYNPIPGVLPNVPSGRDYENGFGMELITKDVKIAFDCAKQAGLDLDLTLRTLEQYSKLNDSGLSKKDFSYVYQYILNNKKLKINKDFN
jgi:3-hydroxyisobutyrate dehydrogenase